MSKGITITMPFLHLKDKSVEVEITASNITYSEIGSTHYGLQLFNDQKNYDKILTMCKSISKQVKELNTLINE